MLTEINNKKEWNEIIAANSGSFLQSWEWGELQKKLGRRVWRLIYPVRNKPLQAAVVVLPKAAERISNRVYNHIPIFIVENKLYFGLNYLYLPQGPVFKADALNDLPLLVKNIKERTDAKQVFLRIEPQGQTPDLKSQLFKIGFKKTKSVQPEITIILNLTKTENDLLNEMEYETRYAIKTAQRRGVKILNFRNVDEKQKHFESFWQVFKETNLRHKLKKYPKNYYAEVLSLDGDCYSELFLAELEQNIIAAAVIVFWHNRAYYLYAASKAGLGRFNAPSLILWEAIKSAKNRGVANFDFWGISLKDKRWSGLTKFKKSFGGEILEAGGAWDFPFKKFWYLIYKTVKLIKNLLSL